MALKQKKFLIILLIFISALFTLYKLQFETRKEIDKIVKEKVERVRVFTAKPGSFATKIRVFAKLYSEKEINIISEVDGTIKEKPFNLGSYVKKGEIILKMTDTRKLLELKEIKDILSTYKAVLDEESKNYKNAITLYKKEIISKDELSSKENLYRKAKSEYDNREATYRRILWEFDNLNIKAPFDGTINKYYYDIGQKILKGQQLIQFSNYSKLIGKVSLKSEDIKNIQINRSTINIINSDSEIEILGTSKEIDKSVFSYLLEFKLNNENKKFLPGEVVEVEIETEAFENYLIFPSKAVVNINNKFYVFIYDNGYAYKIEIEPNWVDNENCAIENFDDYNELIIITEGQSNIQDSQLVEAINLR